MKTMFCDTCQKPTDHTLSVAGKEFHATCACGHFVKFPKVASAQELQALIDAHNRDNVPVVTAAKEQELQDEMQGILNGL